MPLDIYKKKNELNKGLECGGWGGFRQEIYHMHYLQLLQQQKASYHNSSSYQPYPVKESNSSEQN
jgi:hypothetical protein